MERTNLFKSLGASLAISLVTLITPVARFLPLVPIAMAEIEDISQMPINQLWLSWSEKALTYK